MFISLRKYLESRPDQLANSLLRMVHLLLDTVEAHSVKGEAADYERLRLDIRSVKESFASAPAPSEVLVLAGKTVRALEEYNGRTSKFLQRQCVELQSMIAMLTKAMTVIASDSRNSVSRLQDIERQLQSASLLEDFQAAKIRMSECLDGLRTEIAHQRTQSTHRVTEMQTVIEESRERTAARTNREARNDPLTGLPERPAAEAALSAALKQGGRVFAAVFAIERLDLINARFGHEVGDQVLLFFGEHVAQALKGSDRFFRWTGPAFLALMERSEPVHKVREEISRVILRRLSKTVKIANRSVLLPVPTNWVVFDAQELRPLQRLVHSIDSFVDSGGAEPKASAG